MTRLIALAHLCLCLTLGSALLSSPSKESKDAIKCEPSTTLPPHCHSGVEQNYVYKRSDRRNFLAKGASAIVLAELLAPRAAKAAKQPDAYIGKFSRRVAGLAPKIQRDVGRIMVRSLHKKKFSAYTVFVSYCRI